MNGTGPKLTRSGSNVRALGRPEILMDSTALAEQLSVSVRTVHRWTAEGMPSLKLGRRARRYRYSLCVAWLQSRGQVCEDHWNEVGRAVAQ